MLEQAIEEGNNVTIDDIAAPIICVVKDYKIEMMARSDFELGKLERGFKLVALERESHGDDTRRLVAIQLMITQQRSSYLFFNKQ